MSQVISLGKAHRILREHGWIGHSSQLRRQARFKDHKIYGSRILDNGIEFDPHYRRCWSIPAREQLANEMRDAFHAENISCRITGLHEVFVPWIQ